MDCNKCNTECIPISNDCLRQNTRLKDIVMDNFNDLIIITNAYFINLIGDCFNDFCGETPKITNDKTFEILYSLVFEKYWNVYYGSGQYSQQGWIRKRSDEFSDYEIVGSTDIKRINNDLNNHIQYFKNQFLTKYKDCIDNNNKLPCGCNELCKCNKSSINDYSDFKTL